MRSDDHGTDTAPTPSGLALPSLTALLDEIELHLERHGELGLLSVTVLEREAGDERSGWQDYDSVLREIATALARFANRRLRSSDLVLDPIVAGNTFVLLLGPPRDQRSLETWDVAQVRHRLTLELRGHLGEALAVAAADRYGVHVGGSLMRDDDQVERQRIIYRAFEASFADGLGHRPRAGLRDAVHLERVLRSRLVTPVYQPLVDMQAHRVIGFEALTRVPADHFRSPESLFRAARAHGAVWALERICRTAAVKNVPVLEPGQSLFLNIEPDSFHDPHLCQTAFLRLLDRHGLDPRRVVLELTEHAAVEDFAELRRALDDVRAVGFRLAMDDVGSGHSGLQKIAEIRPDYLKVDMTLVRDVDRDPIRRELISTIRRFTDSTGITLVAEGVETREELESLTGAGVRCAQGYLFSRPAAPPDLPDWPALGARATADDRLTASTRHPRRCRRRR